MKEKKDVLFLCQFFYPEYISSATLPYDTAKAFVKSGLSVCVLCGYPKEYSRYKKVPFKEIHEGIEINRLNYIQLKRSNLLGRLINYFSFTVSVLTRFISIRKYKTIIVYSNPPILPLIASLAKKIFGIKVIFVSYDVYPEIAIKTNTIKEQSIISKAMNFINKSLYKNASKVIALSNDMKEMILKNRSQINENQIEVIPNWFEDKKTLNTEKSYKNFLFKDFKLKEKLVISYFGNMGIAQDLNTLIEAIRQFKFDEDVVFVFAGHGNKLPYLKHTVEKEELKNVIIYEFLHGENFQDALNISDVFIVSLEKELTGLAVPSKTYSYMMAGKPVIAVMGTKSDIAKDLIENRAGFALEVGEVDNLVNVIKELKKNEQLRTDMGLNIRRVFEQKYTTEKATSKYVDMIKGILEEK